MASVLQDTETPKPVKGVRFIAKDNVRPGFTQRDALENPVRDVDRIVLPPASFLHEQEKINQRWPAAVEFIKERKLNEFINSDADDIGIITQGGLYNTVNRSLELLGCSDAAPRPTRRQRP